MARAPYPGGTPNPGMGGLNRFEKTHRGETRAFWALGHCALKAGKTGSFRKGGKYLDGKV